MTWRAGSMIGSPLMRPESFRKAMTEPVKVIGADGDAERHFDQALAVDGALAPMPKAAGA